MLDVNATAACGQVKVILHNCKTCTETRWTVFLLDHDFSFGQPTGLSPDRDGAAHLPQVAVPRHDMHDK